MLNLDSFGYIANYRLARNYASPRSGSQRICPFSVSRRWERDRFRGRHRNMWDCRDYRCMTRLGMDMYNHELTYWSRCWSSWSSCPCSLSEWFRHLLDSGPCLWSVCCEWECTGIICSPESWFFWHRILGRWDYAMAVKREWPYVDCWMWRFGFHLLALSPSACLECNSDWMLLENYW